MTPLLGAASQLEAVIAHRSWRIASPPVGRGRRNGVKWQRKIERERTERGRREDVDSRWCILLVCVDGGAKVKSEVWAGCKGGAEEWRVRGH